MEIGIKDKQFKLERTDSTDESTLNNRPLEGERKRLREGGDSGTEEYTFTVVAYRVVIGICTICE